MLPFIPIVIEAFLPSGITVDNLATLRKKQTDISMSEQNNMSSEWDSLCPELQDWASL